MSWCQRRECHSTHNIRGYSPSHCTTLVIALHLFIVFIVCLFLRKIKKKKSLLTEAVKVPNLLSIKEKCSISVQDVIYEEIAERRDMSLTKNEAYVCVSTLRQQKSY